LASPSYTHQHIITQLFGELYNYFKDKECEPYVAPFNIHLEKSNTKNIVQPDLFVMCDKENIRDDKYYGIPTLIIEVISPSTRNNDLIKKLNLYVNSGVKEYVIVDPKNKNIIHWNFNNFEVDKCNTINKDEVFTSNIYKGLSFNLSNIF
jgi:Uma2 family endonuclease